MVPMMYWPGNAEEFDFEVTVNAGIDLYQVAAVVAVDLLNREGLIALLCSWEMRWAEFRGTTVGVSGWAAPIS